MMSQKATATLPTLPVEMLHRIFDELEGTTIFLSIRDACQQLHAAVDTHEQYAVDFTSLSKFEFNRLVPLIRPECITGLSFSDGDKTPGQIGAFFSLVDLGLFARLRSLKLLHIGQKDLCVFLQHASRLSLTSLTIQSRSHFYVEDPQLVEHLSSIIGQLTLLHLELLDIKLSHLANQFQWPSKYKFQYLRMACYLGQTSCEMIDRSPDLKILVHDEKSDRLTHVHYQPGQWFSTPCSRLISLTLLNFAVQMSQVQTLLSQTPSLRYLQIVTRSRYMIDGSRWEDLIKTKLLFLNKFEFYVRFSRYRPVEETRASVPNEMIVPFRTPFWTEEKRWLVCCNFFPTGRVVEIYTSPMCTSSYRHTSDPKMKTISNFEREDQHLTLLETVNELHADTGEKCIAVSE